MCFVLETRNKKQDSRRKKQDEKARDFHLHELSVLPLASNILASISVVDFVDTLNDLWSVIGDDIICTNSAKAL